MFQRYHALCFIHVMSARKLVLDRLRLEIVFLSKKYFFIFYLKLFFLKKKNLKKRSETTKKNSNNSEWSVLCRNLLGYYSFQTPLLLLSSSSSSSLLPFCKKHQHPYLFFSSPQLSLFSFTRWNLLGQNTRCRCRCQWLNN